MNFSMKPDTFNRMQELRFYLSLLFWEHLLQLVHDDASIQRHLLTTALKNTAHEGPVLTFIPALFWLFLSDF